MPAPDARQVAEWVADLDSDEFAVRDRAGRELEKIGELAGPALRRALAGRPPLGMRRRIEDLLQRHERPENPGPEGLRRLRALEALERADTPDACRLLDELAAGPAEARLTQEAKACRARLSRRVAPR
jgi:hypothetical protein